MRIFIWALMGRGHVPPPPLASTVLTTKSEVQRLIFTSLMYNDSLYNHLSLTKAKQIKVHLFCFVFVALRPKSTAMVIAGRSVHLTTRFPWQA